MITVNNYCVGCSRGANNEKGYLSFPKEAVNFNYYLDTMYKDSERKEVKLGSINYFLGYQTKSPDDGQSYPNGNMDGPEKQKKPQTFITRCSYTGWMTTANGKDLTLRRGTGFTTELALDDYKWGFGTLASRDALGGDPSPAVMSSTNLSLISDAGIPIINTGLFGELAEGEFGDVENLDTITSDIEMALETMTEWYKEGFISTEEMLTGVLADYFDTTLISGEMMVNIYGEQEETYIEGWEGLGDLTEAQQNEFKAVASILINGLSVENDSFNTPENVQLLKYLYLRTATNSSSSTGISGEMVTQAIQKSIEDAKYTEGTFKIDDSSSNSKSLGEKSIALGDKNTILIEKTDVDISVGEDELLTGITVAGNVSDLGAFKKYSDKEFIRVMSYGSADGSDGTIESDQTAAVPMLAEAWASEETGQADAESNAPEQGMLADNDYLMQPIIRNSY